MSRALLVLTFLLVALVAPQFGLVVSFIGSITGTLTSMILPSMFPLVLKVETMPLYKLVLCVVIIIVGLVGGGVGAYTSMRELIKMAQ